MRFVGQGARSALPLATPGPGGFNPVLTSPHSSVPCSIYRLFIVCNKIKWDLVSSKKERPALLVPCFLPGWGLLLHDLEAPGPAMGKAHLPTHTFPSGRMELTSTSGPKAARKPESQVRLFSGSVFPSGK